jgi:ferredoxin
MGERLAVDMTRCVGHGLCAVLARDVVDLDQWGYPVVSDAPLDDRGRKQARRAAHACPREALRVTATGPAPLTVAP